MRTIDRARLQGVVKLQTVEDVVAGAPAMPKTDELDPIVKWPQLPVLSIDNVAHYVYRQTETTGWDISGHDLPCVAPTRDMLWMEWVSSTGRERRVAIVSDLLENVNDEAVAGVQADARAQGFEGEFGWTLAISFLVQTRKKVIAGPVGWVYYALDKRGRPVGNLWVAHPAMPLTGRVEGDDSEGERLMRLARIPLQALAFLHCKNVKVDDVEQPAKLSRKYKMKTGRPLVTYQQLRLVVPRRAGGGGKAAGRGIDQPLKIIDGHFAYYGDNHHAGCPPDHEPHGLLFGKLDGVFWVESHARGNAELGVIHTDREVVVPDT